MCGAFDWIAYGDDYAYAEYRNISLKEAERDLANGRVPFVYGEIS